MFGMDGVAVRVGVSVGAGVVVGGSVEVAVGGEVPVTVGTVVAVFGTVIDGVSLGSTVIVAGTEGDS